MSDMSPVPGDLPVAPEDVTPRLEFDVPSRPELDAVTRLAASVAGTPVAKLSVLDELGSCTIATSAATAEAAARLLRRPRQLAAADSLACATAAVAEVFVSADLDTDPRLDGRAWIAGGLDRVRGFAGVAVLVHGDVVGQLAVLDERPREFTAEVVRDLAELAEVAGAALQAVRDAAAAERFAVDLHGLTTQLAGEQAFVRALLEALPVGVVACDAAGRTTLFNRTIRDWSGSALDPRDDTATTFAKYHLRHPDGVPVELRESSLRAALRSGSVTDREMVMAPPDRPSRTVLSSGGRIVDDNGTVLGAVIALADVTEQRRLEQELEIAATKDPLTGLPNRRLFHDRLDHALAAAARSREPVTVLYCDLDGFKEVNDVHGHAAGDLVLVAVAERLLATLRPGDTVSRLGGDEFVLVCPGLQAADVPGVIARLERGVGQPVPVGGGGTARVGVSTGWATSTPGQDAATLLTLADRAMYVVKDAHHAAR